MSSLGNIASHGKVNKVSALTIASFGRLGKVRGLIEFARVEIMRIASFVSRIMARNSTI